MENTYTVTFENSTYCGAACNTCIREKMANKNQIMPNELFYKIVDELRSVKQIQSVSFVGTGDPLTDPDVVAKFKYIKENTPFKIHLTNTCHLLSECLLEGVCKYVDSIKISHYGFSKKTYEKIHGGSLVYEDVKHNIDTLLSRPDRPKVTISFLQVDDNRHEKDAWIHYWEPKCDGVDVWSPHNWGGGLYKCEFRNGGGGKKLRKTWKRFFHSC